MIKENLLPKISEVNRLVYILFGAKYYFSWKGA
jgi:hypothetical protein